MKSYILKGMLLLAVLLSAQLTWAQSDTPPEGGPMPDDPTAVPIDGGASLLLAAGVGLGVRQLRRKRLK
ncbi:MULTISPECIES: PID-CTERM protein-sorting domain-containing protein [Hymenobacter]|uniref:VPDSG-CTERM sorting domain-containing protein n=1 Tax=Hymenobacter guriensis TaxID=2793065 RepID=A0ABS0L575_9BACT|nr:MULTISPECIES: hypothetical protein [Hymenobacter]MBG8555323.1 hypothetical protein [Hymenobacter guriensis]MCR5889054.1 hypothetical protein [Hymenobacter sp. J193]